MQQPGILNWTQTNHRTLEVGRAYDPFEHADLLGIQVIERPIRTANELWLPDSHTLVIKSGMRAVHKRNACAHGVGHAALEHLDDRPRFEVQADRYAAANLIDVDEFRELLKWSPDLEHLVQELGVTKRLIRAFLGSYPAAV